MTPMEVWQSLAVCGHCGSPAPLMPDPAVFEAPRVSLPAPLVSDGRRAIFGALYFRDPFHNPGLPFVNYCGAACSLADSGLVRASGAELMAACPAMRESGG